MSPDASPAETKTLSGGIEGRERTCYHGNSLMSQPDVVRIRVADFLERFRAEMVPLNSRFSYFFAGLPLSEDDVKEYLEEPIAALPPSVRNSLPKLHVVLVPFLERETGKANGKQKRHGTAAPGSFDWIALERPPEAKQVSDLRFVNALGADLLFAVKDVDMADYHYFFYRQIATLAEGALNESARTAYQGMLGDELGANAHGEVDEASWHAKQGLRRRGKSIRRDTKAFSEYAQLSLIDTLTLYLHGICCDIDVETGPRQLPSRFLRKRLVWLESIFPPPEGYAVFPEELDNKQDRATAQA